MKEKKILGGTLYNVAKAFGANDTIANTLGTIGGVGEAFINPISGGKDALQYGTNLVKDIKEFGGLTEFEGNKHSEGGITINPQLEVEGGETKNQDFVFSDAVKPKDSDLTYAELSKKISSKYKKRGDDKMAKESMQRELDALKILHESDPQILKGREKEKMKYGGKFKAKYGVPPFEVDEVEDTLTQPTQYIPYIDSYGNPIITDSKKVYSETPSNMINNPDGSVSNVPNNLMLPATTPIQSRSGNLPVDLAQPQLGNNPQLGTRSNVIPDTNVELNNSNIPISGALLNSIGPVAQLAGTLIGGSDDVNFKRMNPVLINNDRAIQIAEREAGVARATNRDIVSNNANNSGQTLSNLVAGNVAINKNESDIKTRLKQEEGVANAGILNSAEQINTGISNDEKIARQQNKAAYRQAIYGALTDIGNIGSGYIRDNALLDAENIQNERSLSVLNSLPYDYNWVMDSNGNLTLKRK